MESAAPFSPDAAGQPPVTPVEAPLDPSVLLANTAEQAATNPFLRVAGQIGKVARNAYEATVVTLGNMQAGVGPSFEATSPTATAGEAAEAAATAEPAVAASGNRWGNLLARGGNVVRWSAAATVIGGAALKVLALRHGIETGGSGAQHMQTVADTLPNNGGSHVTNHEFALAADTVTAESNRTKELHGAEALVGIAAGVGLTAWAGFAGARHWGRMGERRDLAVAQYQRDLLIRSRAQNSAARRAARFGMRSTGTPMVRPEWWIADAFREYGPSVPAVPPVPTPPPTSRLSYWRKGSQYR